MTHISKIILSIIVGAAIGGGLVYVFLSQNVPEPQVSSTQDNTCVDEWKNIVQYNCEQSGGSYENNSCVCPFEEELGQTSQSMYEVETGYCQTTYGGPGGAIMEEMQRTLGLLIELNECREK